LEAQGIDLEPQHKIGPAASRMPEQGLEAERVEDHARIARENGEKIIANPQIALDAITRQQATFTRRDLAQFAFRHSDGKEQFDQVMSAVRTSPELVALGKDGRGEDRFTSREMIETEQRLERAGDRLADRGGHGLPATSLQWGRDAAGSDGCAGDQQRDALAHITGKNDLAIVVGYAGTGKSAMLGVAREEWERAAIRCAARRCPGSRPRAGRRLRHQSRTIASMEYQWGQGRELLGPRDVLVIDEAGMIGTRQMERVLPRPSGPGPRSCWSATPSSCRRSRPARRSGRSPSATARPRSTRFAGSMRTGSATPRGRWRRAAPARRSMPMPAHGMVHAAETREAARAELIDTWDAQRRADPDKTRIILTHTNAEVRELNQAARDRLRDAGELGQDVRISAERARATSPAATASCSSRTSAAWA
jgi:ATP-dependent exoDNAse (exonuclease V) alpha subunit